MEVISVPRSDKHKNETAVARAIQKIHTEHGGNPLGWGRLKGSTMELNPDGTITFFNRGAASEYLLWLHDNDPEAFKNCSSEVQSLLPKSSG